MLLEIDHKSGKPSAKSDDGQSDPKLDVKHRFPQIIPMVDRPKRHD